MSTSSAIVGTLLVGGLLCAAASNAQSPRDAASERADETTWTVDSALPGPDLPPVGRSLFDYLLARGSAANAADVVPFPFSALLSGVDGRLRRDSRAPSSTRAVLIPLGRSLQRNAASPSYFESPRIVVGIDAEPRETATGLVPLRDRLYLGYQPRADVIEVISYNEAAGRFEFQVVSDYRAGARAKVRYARRAVCMACHQNGGPIFSRGVWSETNANPRVAAALRRVKDRFEGIEIDHGVDVPAAIDASVRRANRLAGYQWLWRNGCAARGSGEPEVRCRAQALIAALQFRLSGSQAYDDSPAFRDGVHAAIAALASVQHGSGLALPDPGLANRDPLQPRASNPHSNADYTLDANVTPAYDPLSPRPPLETWSWGEPDLLARRLVSGLAEFLSNDDVRRLDAMLVRAALANKALRRRAVFGCEMDVRQLAQARRRLEFSCVAPGRTSASGPRVEGSLLLNGARVESGSIDRMSFAGENAEADALRNIEVAGGSVVTARGRNVATLRIGREGMHVRRSDGNAIENVRLSWAVRAVDATAGPATEHNASGDAVVTTVEDFAPISRAVGVLQRETLNGASDALSAQPFRRAAVLSALERRLGSTSRRWCCLEKMAGPVVDEAAVVIADGSSLSVAEIAFHRHCALCHRSTDAAPPNFLAGTQQQVRANLAHCAQRLYVRLAMWDHATESRAKTPMPPFTALRGARVSEAEWRASADLAALRGYVAKILQHEGGKFESADTLLETNYERLRACLP